MKKIEYTKDKTKEQIIEEFYRISEIMQQQGDIDCIIELIPYKNIKKFVDGWHYEDE